MTELFEIYFEDLNPLAQQELLNFFDVAEADMNMEMSIVSAN